MKLKAINPVVLGTFLATLLNSTLLLADKPVCKEPPVCKPAPVCPPPSYAYAPGTIAFKPLNFSFGSLAFGHRRKDSFMSYNPVSDYNLVNNVKVAAYRRTVDLGFAESDRNAVGYGVELGVVAINDWEIFGRFGFSKENANARFLTGSYSYDFKNRHNYGFSFGPRKYFDFQTPWKPFVQLAAGFTVQGNTDAVINWHLPTSFNINDDIRIQTYRLAKRKTLFTGELGVGTDYAFTDYFALSASVAVRYNQRGGSSTTQLPGLQLPDPNIPPLAPTTLTYKSNIQKWVVPFTVSLKFMF